MHHPEYLRMLKPSQQADVLAQDLGHDIAPFRFVDLVGDFLVEHEHGRRLADKNRTTNIISLERRTPVFAVDVLLQ